MGCEPDLVDDYEVGFEDGFDDASDGVVGEAAVEGLDEVRGSEVSDLVAGLDRGAQEFLEAP